jgi:predicted SAM-dependent methyltransferase
VKERLILGTINYVPSEDGWHNTHCDASSRQIWNTDSGGVDVDYVMDAAELTFPDGVFDEVRMWHTLEHLTARRGRLAVEHVFRVLKFGGTFDVEVPDMDRLCDAWCHERYARAATGTVMDDSLYDFEALLQWFYSEDVDGVLDDPHLNAHMSGWNEELLSALLSDVGFRVGDRLDTGLALRYRAEKPA